MNEKVIDFFGNIHINIINLPDCIERRSSVERQFSGYKNLNFVEAIDGRDDKYFKENYEVNYSSELNFSNGVIGCICSHAKAIYLAYKNGLENVIVFEDDVHIELIEQCNFTLSDVLKINSDWEIIQLYYTRNLLFHNEDFRKNGINLLARDQNYPGSCYVINRRGMERFLSEVVRVSDDLKCFNILHPFIDPEEVIFGGLKSFVINRPFCYYYFETMAFDNYFNDNEGVDIKVDCQVELKKQRDVLKSIYEDHEILDAVDLSINYREIYNCYLKIGQIYSDAKQLENATLHWEKAYDIDKTRAEAIYFMVNHYRMIRNYDEAYNYYKLLPANYKNLNKDILLNDVYEYQLDYELSIIAYYVDQKAEGIESYRELFKSADIIPSYIRLNILDNFMFFVDSVSDTDLDLFQKFQYFIEVTKEEATLSESQFNTTEKMNAKFCIIKFK